MSVCDLNLNVASQVFSPEAHKELLEVAYSPQILESMFAASGAMDFFQAPVDESWKNNLSIHQSIRVRFRDYENPFEKVQVEDVQYIAGEECPPRLDPTCATNCISSAPTYRSCEVLFNKKFRIGVQWCPETETLLYGEAETRYRESVDAAMTVVASNGWNELICQAIASPEATILPRFQSCFATHYYDAATADPVLDLTEVINYLQRLYGQRFMSEFVLIIHPDIELAIATQLSGHINNYDNNGVMGISPIKDVFAAGGYRTMPSLSRLWGVTLVVADAGRDHYTGANNHNAFENADGSKVYALFASRRSFFHGAVTLMDKKHYPATCDNPIETYTQTWMDYNKILFPEEIFVVALDSACLN